MFRDESDKVVQKTLASCKMNHKQGRTRHEMISQQGSPSSHLHGYRLHSIESYSGEGRVRVVYCLDYYANFAGPNYVWRSEAIVMGSIHTFAQEFFQLSLAKPALLETVLAICQADLDLRQHPSRAPSVPVLRHRDRALRLLRQGLSSADAADDRAFSVTVVGLITIDMIFEEWASYHVHLNYLRALLQSYGGIESLGWQGWFAYAYTWAELRWATQMARRARLMSTEACLGRDLRPELQPLHVSTPFPSTVLPIGFQEMVDSGLLNATIVGLLVKVTGWGLALAGDFARMIPFCSLSQIETLLCISVVAYIVSFIEGPEGHSRGLEDLTADLDFFDCRTFDTPFCLWAATVIAAANSTVPAPLLQRWTLIDRMMAIEDADKTWPEAVSTFEKFFWAQRHESHWKQCWHTARGRNAANMNKLNI